MLNIVELNFKKIKGTKLENENLSLSGVWFLKLRL